MELTPKSAGLGLCCSSPPKSKKKILFLFNHPLHFRWLDFGHDLVKAGGRWSSGLQITQSDVLQVSCHNGSTQQENLFPYVKKDIKKYLPNKGSCSNAAEDGDSDGVDSHMQIARNVETSEIRNKCEHTALEK